MNNQTIKIDPSQYPSQECISCKGVLFQRITIVKILPPLLTGGVAEMPLEFMVCSKCGEAHPSCKLQYDILSKPPVPKLTILRKEE